MELVKKNRENYLIPEELALISAKSSKSLSSFPVPVVEGNRSAKIPFSKLSKAWSPITLLVSSMFWQPNKLEDPWPVQGLLYRWTEHSADFFWKKYQLGEGNEAPKLHPGGGFFGPWSFITLKNSHQDLSNERSNFTKEFLEVGHWALKHSHFLTNYLKLQILASYNNLRIGQDSEFPKFWPRALKM